MVVIFEYNNLDTFIKAQVNNRTHSFVAVVTVVIFKIINNKFSKAGGELPRLSWLNMVKD